MPRKVNVRKGREETLDLAGLRQRMAARGIFTITRLAGLIGCRRETIYFALAHPDRYPHAYARIVEVTA